MSEQTPYPQNRRLADARDDILTVHEFLDWCESQDIVLATPDDRDRLVKISEDTVTLVERSFGIDSAAVEAERRAMLESLRRPA
ncbi:DNA binding protein [Gordonia phage Aleemily]|uniref:DNA binding protein n=1 Tax=Gordonia phage Aleemily TaxID=2965181 RepID=A0A9E7QDJ1_9CAUD|nr:DNA binding protein [Gordonia phage Aleemily]